MIILSITEDQFISEFEAYAHKFSREGLCAIYKWLEDMSEDDSKPYELDAIAICCEFSEYSDLAEIQADYSVSDIDNIDDLRDLTSVIEFDGGLIIQQF